MYSVSRQSLPFSDTSLGRLSGDSSSFISVLFLGFGNLPSIDLTPVYLYENESKSKQMQGEQLRIFYWRDRALLYRNTVQRRTAAL